MLILPIISRWIQTTSKQSGYDVLMHLCVFSSHFSHLIFMFSPVLSNWSILWYWDDIGGARHAGTTTVVRDVLKISVKI